ncbi:MAG TPA: anti-sigma factor antagonist [Sorangium sp.]|uniref:anti-sigma factor antagonist n=1 Tax=Sorangium sp. So ce1153 TaxID=3133333 RepID=UPI002C02F2F4|nr:anti-sigma factor antagonist [Sorangium sp.]
MKFDVILEVNHPTAELTLTGDLDAASAQTFREFVDLAARHAPGRLVLRMDGLRYMASAGLRVLVFAKQKLGDAEIVMVGAQESVLETIRLTGLHRSVTFVDALPGRDIPQA